MLSKLLSTPSRATLQHNKFPPKLPYLVVSLSGIGLCGIVAHRLVSLKYSCSCATSSTRRHRFYGLYRFYGNFCAFIQRILEGLKRFFAFVGKRAMLFYVAQGISSSFLLHIAPHIHAHWALKLMFCFLLNVGICVILCISYIITLAF